MPAVSFSAIRCRSLIVLAICRSRSLNAAPGRHDYSGIADTRRKQDPCSKLIELKQDCGDPHGSSCKRGREAL
jgi:hypothetical protein